MTTDTEIPIRECPGCYRELPFTVGLWGGNTYDGTMCKKCTDEARNQSRANANYYRSDIIKYRARFSCELCHTRCGHILRLHHIIQVKDGGNGLPGNLIALCPNCHANVHYFDTHTEEVLITGDRHPLQAMYFYLFGDDVEKRFYFFEAIASGKAEHRDGEWHCYGKLLSEYKASVT